MAQRTCDYCGAELPRDARPTRRFCSPSHRQAAYAERQRDALESFAEVGADAIPEDAAAGERDLVGVVVTAAKRGEWRAAAWVLERRYRERWSLRALTSTKPPEERDEPPAPIVTEPAVADPFDEVDELAERRTAAAT